MPVVQGPDGKVISFPDGMPESDINTAMSGLYGGGSATVSNPIPQTSGLARNVGIPASAVARGLATGLGLPGTVESLLMQGGAKLGLDSTPGTGGPWGTGTVLPTIDSTLAAGRSLGMVDRPGLNPMFGPNPVLENLVISGASGAGSAAPMALTGGIGNAVKLLTAGGLGGVASESVHQLLPDNETAPVVAGALTGLGVQGVASKLAGSTVSRIAAGLGSSKTLQQSGAAVQDEARTWLASMPGKEKTVWDAVDAAIPTTSPTPLTSFNQALADITAKGGVLSNVIQQLRPQLPDRLQKLIQQGPVGLFGITPTWQDVRELRTALGDALNYPDIVRNIGQQNRANLYRAATEDLQTTARANGAEDVFAAANAKSTQLHEFTDNVLENIIAGPKKSLADPAAETVASKLLSGGAKGGTDLNAIRAEMPSAVDELAAGHLQTAPEKWLKLSPEARAALVPDPVKRNYLDKTISRNVLGPSSAESTLSKIAGSHAGAPLGIIAGGLLGDSGNIAHMALTGALGELAGWGAPMLYRGVRSMVQDPSTLTAPAVGGLAGAHSLFPYQGLPMAPGLQP